MYTLAAAAATAPAPLTLVVIVRICKDVRTYYYYYVVHACLGITYLRRYRYSSTTCVGRWLDVVRSNLA